MNLNTHLDNNPTEPSTPYQATHSSLPIPTTREQTYCETFVEQVEVCAENNFIGYHTTSEYSIGVTTRDK